VDKHIVPRIGGLKLATLTMPRIEAFRDDLLAGMSRALAKKVLGSLKAIMKDARRRGNVAQNAAADVRIATSSRDKTRLEVGRDIPTRDEVRRILDAAPGGRARALLMTAAFTGLRASELRGLRWGDVDLSRGKLTVSQRADRFNNIGAPKSASGKRELPIGPMVVNVLKQWKLVGGKRTDDLVFATGAGTVENHSNITHRILDPAQVGAGVVDKAGATEVRAARLPSFLCELVHQPPTRRRPRAATEDRPEPARARKHRHDAGPLRAPLPVKR
jgi:integrase